MKFKIYKKLSKNWAQEQREKHLILVWQNQGQDKWNKILKICLRDLQAHKCHLHAKIGCKIMFLITPKFLQTQNTQFLESA